jgi:hypothetical protein
MSDTTATEHLADLDLRPNEASGLLRVGDPGLLERAGWDRAFWSVLDEVDLADCVALLGHRAGAPVDSGWEIERLAVDRTGDEGRADDAEALARHDGWVYLFGSQHGGKDGPIRRREQWVARFREDGIAWGGERLRATVEVVRSAYLLHRVVNDALLASDLRLVPMRDATRAAFIDQTVAELAGTPAEGQVRPDDWTINVEGAEFARDGRLLLGLRFPVTEDGRPVIVEVDGCAGLFESPQQPPEVTALWEVDAVGRGGDLAGVRDLCLLDDELHLVSGNLDSAGKGSVILDDYPGGLGTVNTHFVATLGRGGGRLDARVVREFPDHPKIEGIAADGAGRFFYVSDEDETVHLRCTPLLSGS